MSRLTKYLREAMVKTLVNHAFNEKIAVARKELVDAGVALYMSHHADHLKTMQKLPKSFLYESKYFDTNIGGQRHQVQLDEYHLMTYESNRGRVAFDANNPVAIAFLKVNDRVNDLDKQRDQMIREVSATLDAIPTFKKLWEIWPESKSLLEKYEQKPTIAMLPAIQVSRLNTALGLPAEVVA